MPFASETVRWVVDSSGRLTAAVAAAGGGPLGAGGDRGGGGGGGRADGRGGHRGVGRRHGDGRAARGREGVGEQGGHGDRREGRVAQVAAAVGEGETGGLEEGVELVGLRCRLVTRDLLEDVERLADR